MSLSCALWATSLHQWARRYLRRSQPARCHPEKRARMRAFFAEGVDKMHIPWAVEGLPTLLHLSLFLFFSGVAVFLFSVDREVFGYVVWWIGLFCLVYGMITVLPLIWQDSPYNSPLSTPAWFVYATMTYVTIKILRLVIICFFCLCCGSCSWSWRCYCSCYWFCDTLCDYRFLRIKTWMLTHIGNFGKYHRRWMSKGVEMAAEEAVSERLSKIDVRILDWTITTLGDDDSLKNFFEAIPGFFSSKLVKHLEGDLPEELFKKIRDALGGFLGRTWSSNSIDDSEKLRRLDIATKAMNLIHRSAISFVYWDEMLQVAMARILASVRERDDKWIVLAARVFGLPEQDLRDNIALGDDSVLLAILIHVARQSLQSFLSRSGDSGWMVLETLSEFDIRNTIPRLQHDFCTLWNEIFREGFNPERHCSPVYILKEIHHHYTALHKGTDAASSAFFRRRRTIFAEPSPYVSCNLASHHPDSTSPLSLPLSLIPLSHGNSSISLPHSSISSFSQPSNAWAPSLASPIESGDTASRLTV